MQQKIINKKIKLVDGIVRPQKIARVSNVACLRGQEYRTNPKKTVLYSGLKMAGVAFIALVFLVSISSVGSTVSYFNDVETSIGNYLRADPLSFSVLIASSTSLQIDLSGGDLLMVPVMMPGLDSEPIQYFVTASTTGGDIGLCSALQTLTTFPFPYNGPLESLQTATTTDIGPWALTFYISDASLFSNTWCTVDLVYKGWNADSPPGKGYSDTAKVSLTFFVPGVSVASFIATVDIIASTTDVIIEASASSTDSIIESVLGESPTTTTKSTTTTEVILPSEPPLIETSTTTDSSISDSQIPSPVSDEIISEVEEVVVPDENSNKEEASEEIINIEIEPTTNIEN